MQSLLINLVLAMVLGTQCTSFAQSCYETTVQSPSPFMGNNGEIIKLGDGSLWEVKNAYEYLYEYHPAVVVCPEKGKLTVKGKSINVQAVSSRPTGGKSGGNVIESMIVSKFEGLNAGNFYKLANGQIWEQTEPWVWVWIWVNPAVMIYPASGGYKMKVENIEHPVLVQRIK